MGSLDCLDLTISDCIHVLVSRINTLRVTTKQSVRSADRCLTTSLPSSTPRWCPLWSTSAWMRINRSQLEYCHHHWVITRLHAGPTQARGRFWRWVYYEPIQLSNWGWLVPSTWIASTCPRMGRRRGTRQGNGWNHPRRIWGLRLDHTIAYPPLLFGEGCHQVIADVWSGPRWFFRGCSGFLRITDWCPPIRGGMHTTESPLCPGCYMGLGEGGCWYYVN